MGPVSRPLQCSGLATWPSGEAEACKALHAGSIPAVASGSDVPAPRASGRPLLWGMLWSMSSPAPGSGPLPDHPPVSFTDGAPLGGRRPDAAKSAAPSDRREVLLTALLLVAAVITGAASLMPWRDFGRRFGASAVETGWVRVDGALGRGWVVVLIGVLLAVSGVLIAAGRHVAGRRLAVWSGVALCVVAVAEWGLGTGGVRAGPGLGLWLLLGLGVAVVVTVGNLSPARTGSDRPGAAAGR
jgi:hypothetical protein